MYAVTAAPNMPIWVLQERYRVLAQPKSTYYGATDRYLTYPILT